MAGRTIATRRALSPELVAELQRQNRVLAASPRRQAHLAALSDPDLGVVVTGQQVGLFLGPAYSVYKAATAIALARRRQAEEGRPTVPVFWLQSEDHDAAEVAWCALLDEDDERVVVTLEPSGAERASLAERGLGEGVSLALDQLRDHLDGAPHRGEVMDLLERCYRPEAGWVGAFADGIGRLFADEGLLVMDPRTPAVAALSIPVHRRALQQAQTIDEALCRGAQAARDEGERVGVTPRPGCALSFHHPEGPAGPRYRLERGASDRDTTWAAPDRAARPAADLLAELEREPLCFSTSALLRVILQDHLLPTVAQVAGPGEAQYLRQLPPLRAIFETVEPTIALRGRFVITERADRRRLEALGIAATAVGDREELLRELSGNDPGPQGAEVAARLQRAFADELEAMTPEVKAIEAGLEKSMDRTRRHVVRGTTKLGEAIDRARDRRDATRLARVDFLYRRLSPGGIPQERALCFPHFASRFGIGEWKRALFDAIEHHLDEVERGEPGRLREIAL